MCDGKNGGILLFSIWILSGARVGKNLTLPFLCLGRSNVLAQGASETWKCPMRSITHCWKSVGMRFEKSLSWLGNGNILTDLVGFTRRFLDKLYSSG